MPAPAIAVDGLGKKYRLGTHIGGYGRLSESIYEAVRKPFHRARHGARLQDGEIWALRDVSLEVPEGEVLGIVGKNGAGKTTLLKILAHITEPTEGRARLWGRVGSLLEIGTGFHPELTGRENVYLNGAILGLRKSEIRRKFNEIVSFAEVERFIDTPVKRYSSGMYLRLAFSVAAHLEPEILLVDEVLSVGDAAFQRKCLGKMDDVAQEGRTVVFISHYMNLIQRLCTSCAFLQEGHLRAVGPTGPVIATYLSSLSEVSKPSEAHTQASGPLRLLRAYVGDVDGSLRTSFEKEEPIRITVEYDLLRPLEDVHVGIWFLTTDSQVVMSAYDTDGEPELARCREPGRYRAELEVPAGFLNSGQYGLRLLAFVPNTSTKYLDDTSLFVEIGDLAHEWEHRVGAVVPRFRWTVDHDALD